MTAQSQEAGMSDLIRRIDAMQACQVAPSDEWSKATKGGYNQAATDCAMALLKCEPVPPTLSAAMELPEVRALVKAARPFYAAVFNDNGDVTISTGHITIGDWLALDAAIAALTPTADKEPKT